MELTLILPGHIPAGGIHILDCGPTHHAQWMAVLLYLPKMFGFSDQVTEYSPDLMLKFERILKFTSLLYVKYWVHAPEGCNAPVSDLTLYKDLLSYSAVDEEIASTVRAVLERHGWYLTEEVVPFAMCSSLLSKGEKEDIAKKLRETARPEAFTPGKPKFPILSPNTELTDLLGPNSWLIFKLLGLSGDWLWRDCSDWKEIEEFQAFENYVTHTKVINDCAERAIKLWSDYLDVLTSDESKKQGLVQVVEDHRKKNKGNRKGDVLGADH